MNKNNLDYLKVLNNEMIKGKFLILAYFIKINKSINYKILNLLIYRFFEKKLKIHSFYYEKYFINNNLYTLNFNNGIVQVQNITFSMEKIKEFQYEISKLNGIYNDLLDKNNKDINKLYNKIF